jgi:hypothetical protein
MRTPSIRTLAALAYERGEEFDPAASPTPARCKTRRWPPRRRAGRHAVEA